MTIRSAGTLGQRSNVTAILAIILVSYFMIILDNSIVFTGMPRIRDEFGLSTTGLAWVTDAYVLTFGGLLLLAARAGDILGRRRVFLVGLAVFSVASFLVAVAPTAVWLLAARAVQGVGAAILAPTTLALLTATFSVALPMLLLGIGQGMTLGPLTGAGIAGVAPQDAGAASGLANTTHQLGGSLGVAILTAVAAHVERGSATPAALAEGVSAALTTSAVMLALAAVVAVLVIRSRPQAPIASNPLPKDEAPVPARSGG